MNGQRVFVGDVVSYEVPSSLADLHGPDSGVLVLPMSVYWGPEKECRLDSHDGVVKAYQAIIREGTLTEQTDLLNVRLLRRVWPWLLLPARCRQLWESRHPSLAAVA